ncbi:hypothetical protein [Lysobacter gummosus]|uniref:hypothetical protein n=1 Tax=Lysobacter gummosus TaxID=262324 RepID=UPI003640867F
MPEPVTPSRVCCAKPLSKPCTSFSIACGWSPAGEYGEINWKPEDWGCRPSCCPRLS